MSKGFGKVKPSKQNTPQNTPHLVVLTIIRDGELMEVLSSSSSNHEKCLLCGDEFKEIGKICHWCLNDNDLME
jgi:hypothetical protein